jgi:pectate lyase
MGDAILHSLKCNYPYYQLMWEVDPTATRKFIEAYWSTHILNWSNLAMNRGVPIDKVAGIPWNHKYRGGQVFFESGGISFLVSGSDLFCAAGFLGGMSDDKEPLIWAKRLMHRYVETRTPGVGISGAQYTRYRTDSAQVQLGEDFEGHRVLGATLFPSHPEMGDPIQSERFSAFVFVSPGVRHNPAIAPWASALLLGDMLGSDGREFIQRSHEELTAWGKVAYRKEDNSFIPMLTDGTSLEG